MLQGTFLNQSNYSIHCVGAVQPQSIESGARHPTAIILEPTKDLAEQTARVVESLQSNFKEPTLKSILILGGENMKKQANQLRYGVDIVTGTPGKFQTEIQPDPSSELLPCVFSFAKFSLTTCLF